MYGSDVSPAQSAAHQQAWIPRADEGCVGPRGPVPPAEEGALAPHRPPALQAPESLTGERYPSRAPDARDADTALPLATPVLGGQADGEALAPLLPPAGQDRAAPHILHPRAESMLVDAPPIARAIRRTHTFLS